MFVNRPICAMLHADLCIVSFNPLFACPLVCSHNPGSRSANPAGGKTSLFLLFFFVCLFFAFSLTPCASHNINFSLYYELNLSPFFLYVQILEFEMDFFSPFIQPNSLCAPILWAKLINPKIGSS